MLCITTAYNYVAAGVLNSYDISKIVNAVKEELKPIYKVLEVDF